MYDLYLYAISYSIISYIMVIQSQLYCKDTKYNLSYSYENWIVSNFMNIKTNASIFLI